MWYLNGTTLVGAASLPTLADTNWELVASSDVNAGRRLRPDLAPPCKRSQCRVVSESNNSHRDGLVADCRRWDLANDRSQIVLTAWIDRLSSLARFDDRSICKSFPREFVAADIEWTSDFTLLRLQSALHTLINWSWVSTARVPEGSRIMTHLRRQPLGTMSQVAK